MKKTTIAGLGLATLLALAACSNDTEGTSGASAATPGTDPVACVQAAECTTLAPAEFADLAAADGVVLLDVRTPQEFAEGHLDGAVNLDVSAADFTTRLADLDPEATYAVYCRSGNRSQTALGLMSQAGIDGAADLAGGIGAWVGAGLPVTTD
ncbi:rhodanese-like domain-containing protein [Actinotalea fermentans]|nr:rhodanese-like domain-containing protein [Actinotalea fermentans]KGM17146.1 hypothetical protein N867_09450 [Actinotalea fermentans ATCC 43279 = JCM 9966 = DSM 3133]